MKYQIREANLSDYQKIQPIHKEVHDLHVNGRPDKYKPSNNTLDFDYFKSLVYDNNSIVYIIESDGKIIAFTFLRKYEAAERDTIVKNTYVFMEDFGVAGSFRGEGFGKLLFNKAIEFAKKIGAVSLELGVWEFNRQAIKFYEAMGMKTQARKMEIEI
ncbi:GNAT family N-acetyltransferase [Heyndrickxia sporothermodurans]|uniref:GNAT family N-acetyltransferase n=1 Tax=Heyndrickxia vini TaxID=1476025 RepID=A0ABX7E5X5_9BACI|nr:MULTISPECIES: GNAT family N-acetyltransferase [Heyndrickxia]MEB6550944.1 GNAT family N-acetyltransferase [Heyndrickxia sporothermodurans]QQZ09742.1 GNAT family N-acetyltransferase [Heyndrickxia vini]